MKRLLPLMLCALLAPAHAQTALAADSPPVADAPVLKPFVASYQVFNGGARLGDATLQLVRGDGPRWRIDLVMKGSGLMRLTGLNVQQSTVFDSIGQRYRPLSQSTLRRVAFSSRNNTGVYDWNTHSARWQGDVKQHRVGPIALQDGDMSGLLINLAVIRDALPGKTLQYRFVDDGRARDHQYAVAAQTEGIEVDGLRYDAMRVDRIGGNQDSTTLWVAAGVPTPIRILQRENGRDTTDLRLIQYQGVE